MQNMLDAWRNELGPTRRRHYTTCEFPACSNFTREGKPMCTDHVKHMPYVEGLLSSLEHKRESRRLKKVKAKQERERAARAALRVAV